MPKSIALEPLEELIDLPRLKHYDRHVQERTGKSIALATEAVKQEITESIEEKVNDAIGEKLDDGKIQEKVDEAIDAALDDRITVATNAAIDNMFEAVKLNLHNLTDEEAQIELGGKELGNLVGEDFKVVLSDNKVTASGTINKIANWSAAFPEESKETDYYIPLILTGTEGDTVEVELLGGGTKDNVFGETGDGDDWMALVLAVKEADPYRTFTVYADKKEDGRVVTVDCSGCTFAD